MTSFASTSYMKCGLLLCAALLAYQADLLGQYSINQSLVFGGNDEDVGTDIVVHGDGRMFFGGASASTDMFLSSNNGGTDYWLMALTPGGDTIWSRSFGGSNNDDFKALTLNDAQSRVAAIGTSFSSDGDVGNNPGVIGAWVLVLDTAGNQIVSRTFSGDVGEQGADIASLSDGGYAVLVNSASSILEGAVNNGSFDYWVARTNAFGSVIWAQSLGGSEADLPQRLMRVSGGYVAFGSSNSTDGLVVGNHGGFDFWVVKLDVGGDFVWARAYGGSGDEMLYDAIERQDGSFLITGATTSSDGNVSDNNGETDLWIVSIDADGNLLWQETYGGSSLDKGSAILEMADSSIVVVGTTESSDGDVLGSKGHADGWIVYLSPSGQLIRQNHYGGSQDDELNSIVSGIDQQIVVVGSSFSNRTNLPTTVPGDNNMWFLQLVEDTIPCNNNTDACFIDDLQLATVNAASNALACFPTCNAGLPTGPVFGPGCYDFSSSRTAWIKINTDSFARQMTITIDSDELNSPKMALFQTNDCNDFLLLECSEGNDGSTEIFKFAVNPDTSYYIAVADSAGLVGNFQICVNVNDLNFCKFSSSLTVLNTSLGSPANGPYLPGEQVSFCYEIQQWQKKDCNGLQGIIPAFGPGWDSTWFNALGEPNVVDDALNAISDGNWEWIRARQVSYNFDNPHQGYAGGQRLPAGWYFTSTDQNDVDLSLGDLVNCSDDSSTWQVCFTLRTREDCTEDMDCRVEVKTFADGEIGANVNQQCQFDPPDSIPAILRCCVSPRVDPIDRLTICSGDTVTLALASTLDPNAAYVWTVTSPPDIVGAEPGIGALFRQTLANFGDVPLAANYSVVAQKEECVTPAEEFPIIVLPLPRATMVLEQDDVFCEGDHVPFRFQFFSADPPYRVQVSVDGELLPLILLESNNSVVNIPLESSSQVIFESFQDSQCDGLATGGFDVEMEPLSTFTLDTLICEGDTLQVGDVSLAFPGTYDIMIEDGSQNGCDSVVTVLLGRIPTARTVIDTTICAGDTIFVGDKFYTESGNFTDTLSTSSTCDSIVNLLLFATPEIVSEEDVIICAGDGVLWGDTILTESGTYIDTIPIKPSCDSIKFLQLAVLDNIILTETTIIPDDGGNSGAIFIEISGGLPPYEYLWSTGDTTDFIEDLPTGDYSVTITDLFSCAAVFNFFLKTNTSNPLPGISEVSAFPNPAMADTRISVSLHNTNIDLSQLEVRLTHISGQMMSKLRWDVTPGDNTLSLQLNGQGPGLHYMVLTDPKSGAVQALPVILLR